MHAIQQAISANQSYSKVREIIQNNTDLLSETTTHENNLFPIFILTGRHDLVNKLLVDLLKDIQARTNQKSCSALITTVHALLLKLNNKGVSALHLAAHRGILSLLKTTLLASNDITLIGLALTHCSLSGENIQHIVLKKIIELKNTHEKHLVELLQYIKIYHLILSISSDLHFENVALFWYTHAHSRQITISEHILQLLTRMSYEEINHLIKHPEQSCETITDVALMLTDSLLLQDSNGNNTLHLIAMSQYKSMLEISLEHLSAYQMAIALQVKNMNKKSLLILIYEQNHRKDDVITMTKFITHQLSQKTVCPKVFIIFYISLIECREHIENIDKEPFNQLQNLTTEILQNYLTNIAQLNQERPYQISNNHRSLADELANVNFLGRLSAIDLDKIRENKARTMKKNHKNGTKFEKERKHAATWGTRLETEECEPSVSLGTSTNQLQTLLQQASATNKQILSELKGQDNYKLSMFSQKTNKHEKECTHDQFNIKPSHVF